MIRLVFSTENIAFLIRLCFYPAPNLEQISLPTIEPRGGGAFAFDRVRFTAIVHSNKAQHIIVSLEGAQERFLDESEGHVNDMVAGRL